MKIDLRWIILFMNIEILALKYDNKNTHISLRSQEIYDKVILNGINIDKQATTNNMVADIIAYKNENENEKQSTRSLYSNPADTFQPSEYMNIALSISDRKVRIDNFTTAYIIAFCLIPAILIVLALLTLFFFNFGLLFRCCCFCCKCLPQFDSKTPEDDKLKVLERHKTVILVFFYLFGIFTLVADQLTFTGNISITKGIYICIYILV
jgi:hypothetical protein